jgi:acetyl esterase/lipase
VCRARKQDRIGIAGRRSKTRSGRSGWCAPALPSGTSIHKIGVLGFSAGGHMVAALSTHFDKRLYPPIDASDKESCRPDFAVALYPGHLAIREHNFTLNPDIHVTSQTPPTFLVQAKDDPVDPVENSLVYYAALRKADVPAEIHVYAKGGHAFGLRRTESPITRWPELVETWIETITK